MQQGKVAKLTREASSAVPGEAGLYQWLMEQASDAIVFAKPDGLIELWNSGAEEIFGYSAGEVIGKSLDVIIPEQLREAHWKGFHRAIAEGRTKYERIALTTQACHKTNRTLYIDLTFSIVKDPSGRVLGAQASARDVTERYLAERALREGAMALGFLSLDLDWKVTYANSEVERILGKSNLTGRSLWDEFPDLIATPLYERAYLAVAEQTPAHFENFFPSLNAWLEFHAYPSPAGLALYIRNINRAKRIEEELARTEQTLSLLVSQAREYSIIMVDPHGMIRNWNLGAERLYRYRAEEVLGHHFSMLVPPDERSDRWPSLQFKKALEVGSYEEEVWRARKDGTRFLADVVITALRDSSGRLQGFSSVTRDITERHEAETERSRLLKEAQDAVNSRDELLSIASHEIRTPLTALSLQLQMLHRTAMKRAAEAEQSPLSAPTLRMIESCERQSQRLSRLLDELLDITRVRLGKLKLNIEEIDLSQVAKETVERFSADAARAGSSLTLHLAPGILGQWDLDRLDEITNNLLSNAIKYGNGKPIEVGTDIDPSRGVARFIVKDQGIGIPKDMLDKIFSRFERAETGQKIKGVGLGLYIVRQLVEAHHGTISVESELERGSIFTVELPLRSS